MQARCRKVYGNAHTYHINAISISSDQETFISSDDLRVNLWHLDHTNQSFNVVDIKPPNMEDLTEVSQSQSPAQCSTQVTPHTSKSVPQHCVPCVSAERAYSVTALALWTGGLVQCCISKAMHGVYPSPKYAKQAWHTPRYVFGTYGAAMRMAGHGVST